MSYPIEIDDWIVRVAKNMARSRPEMIDDLAQEGRVAAWEAWSSLKVPEDVGYTKSAARKHMFSIAGGQRRMLGSEHPRQKIVTAEPTAAEDIPDSSDGLADYVVLAYHHGEIYGAINALPNRQRRATCLMMCDQKMTRTEWQSWRDAKPKLAARLDHLRGLL